MERYTLRPTTLRIRQRLSLPTMSMFRQCTLRRCLDIGDQRLTSTMRSTRHIGATLGGMVALITTRSMGITTTRGDIGIGTTATVHSTIHGICQATTPTTIHTTATRTSTATATTIAQAVREVPQLVAAAATSLAHRLTALRAVRSHRLAAQHHRLVEHQLATRARPLRLARL